MIIQKSLGQFAARFGYWRSRRVMNKIARADRAAIARHMASFKSLPRIALVMEAASREAILAVRKQIYPHWELWIVAGETKPHRDARIKHVQNAAEAIFATAADYVAFVGAQDLICVSALYEVAVAINARPAAKIIYTDEGTLNPKRDLPHHKSGFNIDLLLGWNFIGQLCVYETNLYRQVKSTDAHDLNLQAARLVVPADVIHIPVALYYRRAPAAPHASLAAVQRYLDAEGEGADAVPIRDTGYVRVRRKLPKPEPKVSVIIPTKDMASVLRACVDSLLEKTAYENLEVIIIDNDSSAPDALQLLKAYSQKPNIKVLRYTEPFNYSAMNNLAARAATGTFFALLNNDTEVTHPDWLSEMVSIAARPGIGAVGAKLLFANGTIQHAAVFTGPNGHAVHTGYLKPADDPGYFGNALVTRAVSAVTGACLVVHKDRFIEVGGLEEEHLHVAYNDIDLCLRLSEKGYRNIWASFAILVHHESLSRGKNNTPVKLARFMRERKYFKDRWEHLAAADPFYNPNLSLVQGKFGIVPSRRPKTWADHF